MSQRLETAVRSAAVLAGILALGCCCAPAARAADEGPVDYLTQIKPLLAERCYKCHGPKEQESGLRLDSVASALEGGNSGPAIVRKKSAESRIVHAIQGLNDVSLMPPEDEDERLKPEQVALIKRWIDQGAVAPADDKPLPTVKKESKHWAFQSIAASTPPVVKQRDWVRNPIDEYVLARLESQGIKPSPEADRATLARRLSLDLVGLPPSIAEVERFVSDSTPGAYERLVDRLLSSPHYGERWGRLWLDAARYADSNGYTIDGSRSIWKYRDWVIDAINRDLPFDQFTVEQLAGDMLPDPTLNQIIATGFHRNTLKNEEGGTDQEQFRVDAVADRVETTGSVFLGLTVGCARCHDHKFDPISQREFFQLFAVFNNADEPTLPIPTDQQSKELPALKSEIASITTRQQDTEKSSAARQKEWERRLEDKLDVTWTPIAATELRSASGAKLEQQDDGAIYASGNTPAQDTYTFTAEVSLTGVTAIRVEALADDRLPRSGPGRGDGSFTLSEFTVKARPLASKDVGDDMPVAFGESVADEENEKTPIEHAIDGDPKTGWTLAPAKDASGKNHWAVFVTKDDLAAGGPIRVTVSLAHQARAPKQALGRFRVSVTTSDREAAVVSDEVRKILPIPHDQRTKDQAALAETAFKKVDGELAAILAQVNALKQREKQLSQSVTTTLVMKERAVARDTRVHVRGDFLRPGAPVKPAVPAVLPPLVSAGAVPNRLDFARWLVDEQNPLTPRVTVNRYWQEFFGRGIVETENDFGVQGIRPTHPELLDYLAGEFMSPASGHPSWSMKAIHRLIVTSATYRQSSHARGDLTEKDPDNKLLARQSRLRLGAETVRDVALACGGLLSPEIGGPGVYPPQPEGVYRFTQVAKFWANSEGPDRYRRGLYTYFWRSRPYPFLSTFDAPDGNVTCTRRLRSNTPLQALTLSNDQAFFEAAQALAGRVLTEVTASDSDRVRHAFQLCFAREPSESESQRLAAYLDGARRRFEAAPDEAAKVATKSLPEGASASQAAAWTAMCRVLMNLDEFITRE